VISDFVFLPLPRRLCFHFFSLFVCFTGLCKITQPIFREFDGKVAHGPWKKPLDFGGNLDLEPEFFLGEFLHF